MRSFKFVFRVGIIAGLLLALTLAGTSATQGQGAAQVPCTRYVAPDGDDNAPGSADQPWATPQHASDSAVRGDVICFAPGTYAPEGGEWHITTPDDDNEWIVFAVREGIATIQGGISIGPGASRVHLGGFPGGWEITGYDIWGISIIGATSIRIDNVDVYGGESALHFTAPGDDEDVAVVDVEVSNSRFHDTIYTVVDCTPGPCHWLSLHRVEIFGGGLGSPDFGADGFAVERGSYIGISDSYIHHNSGDGIDLNSRDLERGDTVELVGVSDNRVENNQRNGIKLWRGGTLFNNVVWGSGDTALVLERGSEYVLLHNTFATIRNHNYLATLGYDEYPGETRMTMFYNIFYNDDPQMTGTTLYIGDGVQVEADYNVYFNPYREAEVICAGDACFNAEQINSGQYAVAMGWGANSLYADPLFGDAENGDFHLTGDSPAVDLGADWPTSQLRMVIDLGDMQRPQGAGIDAGAYEFQR